jgi:hypothetical protein
MIFSNFASQHNRSMAVLCEAVNLSGPFNDEFGSNRDASVYGDDAKPKSPARLGRALGWKSSLRMAIQIWGGDHPHHRFGDSHPHSSKTKQSAETVLLISFSQFF